MLIARFDNLTGRTQTLCEHSVNVSRLCGENLAAIGLDAVGKFVGLVHDMGKAKPEFQSYINKAMRGEEVAKGSVIHSTVGMCYIASLTRDEKMAVCPILAELCEYVVGAHHGIFDCVDVMGNVKFFDRMDAEPDVSDVVHTFFGEVPEPSAQLISMANRQFDAVMKKMCIEPTTIDKKANENARRERLFHFGMLVRLVLSALVDADRRDSADFCLGAAATFPPAPIKRMAENCEREVAEMEKSAAGHINEVRKAISFRAKEAGALSKSGAYGLNVPCGAGKTVASMRFALAHAVAHGKRRIFYVAPYLTILDQNVEVIRKLVGGDDLVLEHTSDFDERKLDDDEVETRRLVAENWSAPVVVTSSVRFLETLFAKSGSSVRRMNSLSQSVIVIDEVQALPVKSITMFNAAINFLTKVAGVTVLLCTATLPASPDLAASVNFSDAVKLSKEEREVFHRCNVEIEKGEMTYEQLCTFANSVMDKASRLLLICNTKSEAAQLYRMLAASGRNAADPFAVVHLSAAMCKAHRSKVLERIFSETERLVCVSTQVVEAGVDVSFECVIRLAAGIDNVAQAAGRCNRGGEFGTVKRVYVVRLKEEKLGSLADIKRACDAFSRATADIESFEPADIELINKYYYEYFRSATDNKNETLYPADADGVDVKLYELLSDNPTGSNAGKFRSIERKPHFWQAFGTAGRLYHAIDDDTYSVIVPYDNCAREIICDLCSERAKNDVRFAAARLKDAGPYVISLGKNKLNSLVECGAARALELFDKNVYILGEGEYDEETGFLGEKTIL